MKRIPEYMSQQELDQIKAEIKEIKAMIDSSDENKKSDVGNFEHSAKHLDIEEVKKSISHRELQLRKFTPKKFKGPQANKAYALAKKYKKWIKEHIPKETYFTYPRGKDEVGKSLDFQRAVDRQVSWLQNGQKYITAYNYLMRRLDPDRPPEDFNKYVRTKA